MNKEQRKKAILTTLKTAQIATTPQLELFFKDYAHPKPRCSEFLRDLEEDKWIEGQKNRQLGRAKAWRLGKKGKDFYNIKKRAIPFTSRKLEHQLKITDCFLQLWMSGDLKFFEAEFRREYFSEGAEKKYAPDAIFFKNNQSYILEVQKSPLSQIRWMEKWKVAESFFETHPEFKLGDYTIRSPKILVLSNQRKDIVKAKTKLDLVIFDKTEKITQMTNLY